MLYDPDSLIRSCILKINIDLSGRASRLARKGESLLGLEPVPKFLLLASFKSGNNLVHETVFDKTDDDWFNIFK
jgi:hypothetical protein